MDKKIIVREVKENEGAEGSKLKYHELEQLVVKFLQNSFKKDTSFKQVIKKMGIKDKKTKRAVKSILAKQHKNLQKSREKKAVGPGEQHVGKVDYVNPRFAYIICEDLEKDVYVKADHLMNALDDDTVKVVVFGGGKKGKRPEGKVVEIIERHREEFVGRVEMSNNFAFVIADFRKMHYDIFVHPSKLAGAKANDKVVVKITQWPDGRNKNPVGVVTRVLGVSGENEAEIHSIMAEFELPFEFSESVIRQSKRIKDEITEEEVKKRRDFRKVTTFTIDPDDAKDFDDALSLEKLPNGHFEIGVHIADVTHYVKPDTILDKEAQDRGTSVYLVDRTIPMLPERLSNELCSLRPNEDKLTFSAVFEMDREAKVVKEWFGRTVIHSDRRFSYEEAQERIEKVSGDYAKDLIILNELALKLRVERFIRGAINFETIEVKFDLDENGKPLGIRPKIRKDAHKLVEEFMLLANKRVAEHVYKMKKGRQKNTFVYRVHDFPDPEKLNVFSIFAKKFGHELHVTEEAISKSLNNLIEDIEGKPEQNVLQTLAIRTMAKAKYTTEAKGHFGLAFPHYTHFTSPIRRYPDMMVHRLLFHYLENGNSVNEGPYEKKCEHSSEMEKRSADAERASIKFKQVEFMQRMLGEEVEGIVSGVTEWGVFVEMTETKCEGMVRLADLTDDYYYFDEANYRVVGQRTNKFITLGDEVKVKIVRTDINRRIIDLELTRHHSWIR